MQEPINEQLCVDNMSACVAVNNQPVAMQRMHLLLDSCDSITIMKPQIELGSLPVNL